MGKGLFSIDAEGKAKRKDIREVIRHGKYRGAGKIRMVEEEKIKNEI